MKCRAVVFDLYGTLVDNFAPEAFQSALSAMAAAISAPEEEFSRLWRATFSLRCSGQIPSVEANVRFFCRKLDVEPDEASVRRAVEIRYAFAKVGLTPRPDAVPTLARLKELGYKTGLLSDCSSETPELWPSLPFAPYIDAPTFSCVEGYCKPEPLLYRTVCERLHVSPDDCLYVGDGGGGELGGARKAGMHPVLIRADYDQEHDPYRREAVDWDGPRIMRIEDVLALID